MANYVQRVLHPEWYHGHDKKAPFFEGWYYKCVECVRRTKMGIHSRCIHQ